MKRQPVSAPRWRMITYMFSTATAATCIALAKKHSPTELMSEVVAVMNDLHMGRDSDKTLAFVIGIPTSVVGTVALELACALFVPQSKGHKVVIECLVPQQNACRQKGATLSSAAVRTDINDLPSETQPPFRINFKPAYDIQYTYCKPK